MTYVVTNTFVDGTLIKSSEVNANFTQAATAVSSTSAGHIHDGSDSKKLDWDTCFVDAVHTHASDAEGGILAAYGAKTNQVCFNNYYDTGTYSGTTGAVKSYTLTMSAESYLIGVVAFFETNCAGTCVYTVTLANSNGESLGGFSSTIGGHTYTNRAKCFDMNSIQSLVAPNTTTYTITFSVSTGGDTASFRNIRLKTVFVEGIVDTTNRWA